MKAIQSNTGRNAIRKSAGAARRQRDIYTSGEQRDVYASGDQGDVYASGEQRDLYASGDQRDLYTSGKTGFPGTGYRCDSRHGTSQELESLRIEYQNLFDRSNKLDNKAYITVTFCGFMFVFITSLFGSIPQIHMEGVLFHDILTALYLITCIAVAITYVWNLIYFMRLLAPEGIVRLDPDKIAAAQLNDCSAHEAERRLIELYRAIINEDLGKLHDRCDRFVEGLRFVIVTLVLSFAAYGLQILLKVL